MTRAGTTWKVYSRLLHQVAALYDRPLVVRVEPNAQEEEVLIRFSADLKAKDQAALGLLKAANIGEQHFRYHLRYLARWGAVRRQLLANGGNFQLLEGAAKLEAEGGLSCLRLSGSKAQQVRQLSDHTRQRQPVPEGCGWLAPVTSTTRRVQVYDERQLVWLYPAGEVEFLEGLHPYVARSLIARYVPTSGVVADPMAGDGVVSQMAIGLGHTAWASDLVPSQPYIQKMDLLEQDLGEVFGEEHRTNADLLVLHPPLPETLGLSVDDLEDDLMDYGKWLEAILENCWGAVKAGGHVALIVPVSVAVQVHARAEEALTSSARGSFGGGFKGPTATHLAVSRDGREGWHILMMQSPPINEPAAAS